MNTAESAHRGQLRPLRLAPCGPVRLVDSTSIEVMPPAKWFVQQSRFTPQWWEWFLPMDQLARVLNLSTP